MNQLIGIAVIAASAVTVYFLHIVLKAEVIPLILLLLSAAIVVVDYPRRYFYIAGLVLYPLATTLNVVIDRSQSLYPVIIFYELSMVAMILFGAFLGLKVRCWLEARNVNS